MKYPQPLPFFIPLPQSAAEAYTRNPAVPDNTIYLIDADPAVRDALGLLFGLRGYRAALFSSAEDFISAWRAEWTGCVVMDMQLPGMDGLSLQRKLAEMGCDLPVIVIGGDADFHAARAAFRAHAVDFIEKPLDQGRLVAAIEEAFSRAGTLRAHKLRHEETMARLRELAQAEREMLGLGVGGAESAPRQAAPSLPQPATRFADIGTADAGTVLVLEQHPLMRVGLAAVLRDIGTYRTALAASLEEGLALLRSHPLRLVITDLDLADSSGVATLEALRAAAPGVPIMVTVQKMPVALARSCFLAGARGFLEKGIAPDQMAWAIEVMLRGGQFLPEALSEYLAAGAGETPTAPIQPVQVLEAVQPAEAAQSAPAAQGGVDCSRITGRQRDVARLIAAGLSNKEIARELNISLGTAKNYVAQILSILGAKSRSRAATLMLSRKDVGASAAEYVQ
jgi:DNA-binding NarL/FixJ family response regulator